MKKGNKDLKCKANSYAVKIVIIYTLVSVAWITCSDYITSRLFENKQIYTLFSIMKGWLFVAITAALLYYLIRNKLYSLYLSERQLQNALDDLKKTNLELSKTREKLVGQYRKLAKKQQKIKELAYFDALTGLSNRNHFQLVLDKYINECSQKNQLLALICLDIDNFNRINNTAGYAGGDILLKDVANKLRATIVDNGFVARLAGDEFAIILPNFVNLHILNYYIHKIFNIFDKPWAIMDYDFYVTASMGIAIYPADAQDPTTLLKNADKALSNVKERGKNNFCFYNKQMDEEIQRKFEIESGLRKAIGSNQFKLFYQPIIDLNSKKISGAEALIRWIHPEKGLISPLSFIPIAEETGLISKIGEWVTKNALNDLKTIKNYVNNSFYVSVNISLREFSEADFVDNMILNIENSKVDPASFGIEITESVAMVESTKTVEILNSLKEKGIKILLDDFGTGYSSLNYLRQLPIDILKVDRTFIQNMCKNEKEQQIAKTLIELAHVVDLKVVAEGVEDEKQVSVLKNYSCDFAQGFLFGRPMPLNEFIQFCESSF